MIDISESIHKNKPVFEKINLLNKSLIFSSSILFTPLFTFVDAVKVTRTGQTLSDANRALVTHATNHNVAHRANNTNIEKHATNPNINQGLVTPVIGTNLNSMTLLSINVPQALPIDFSLHTRSSAADASVLAAHSSDNPVPRQSNRAGGKRQRTADIETITGVQSYKKSRNSEKSTSNGKEDMTLYLEMFLGKEDADKIEKYRADFMKNQNTHEILDNILEMEAKTPQPYPNRGLMFESPEYLLKAYKEGVDKYKKIKENFFKLKIDLDVDIDKDKFQSLISKQMFLNLRKEVLDYRSYIPKYLDLLDDRIMIFEQKYSKKEYIRRYFFHNVETSKEKPGIKYLLTQIDSLRKDYNTKYDTTKESGDILSILKIKSQEIETNLEVHADAKRSYQKWVRIYNKAKGQLNYIIKFLQNKVFLRSSAKQYIGMVLSQELVAKSFALDRQFFNITKEWDNFCLKYEYLKKGMPLKSSSVSQPSVNAPSTNLPELQRPISEASTSQKTSFLYSGKGGNSKSRPFIIEGVEVTSDKVRFFSLENFKRWKDVLDSQINFLASEQILNTSMVHRYIDDFKAASAMLDEFNIQLLNNSDFSEKNKLILPLAQKLSESLELAMGYILRNEFIHRNSDNLNSFDARIKHINQYLEINDVFKEVNKSLYDFFYDVINKKISYFINESKHAGNREQVSALNEYLLIFKTEFMTKLKFHADLESKISDNRNIILGDLSELISIFEEKISKSDNLSVPLKQALIDAKDIKSKYDGVSYAIPIPESHLKDIDDSFKNIEDKLAKLYEIPDLELIIPDSERTMTNSERTIHDTEDMIHNTEDMIHDTEDIFHNTEDMIHDTEDMIHDSEDMIHDSEDMIHDSEDIFHDPEYAMSDLERTMPDLERITPGLERTMPGLERITPGLERTMPGLERI